MRGRMDSEVNQYKVYVAVELSVDKEGHIRPKSLTWEDGVTYEIDKLLDVRPGYAAKAGGQGDRYTIVVQGKRTYLYFERSPNLTGNVIGRWFVERR